MANTTMLESVQYHKWKPQPLVRGTFSILSSSLFTMVMCVWTAVHLNIPQHGRANWRLRRKICWMILALLGPEWIVLTAYCEHKDAKELGQAMRSTFGQAEPQSVVEKMTRTTKNALRAVLNRLPWRKSKAGFIVVSAQNPIPNAESGPASRRHPWTHTHSLYATMGGFVVDMSDTGESCFPSNRATLTPKGLKMIAKHDSGLISNISRPEIQDKSKADAFTKVITCGQVLWFITQFLGRFFHHLSISLLELNTVAHAVCLPILYFGFWWNKPLDVGEATTYTDADMRPMFAFMGVCDDFPMVRVSPVDMNDFEHITGHPAGDDIHPGSSVDSGLATKGYTVYHGFAFPGTEYKNCTTTNVECFRLASRAVRMYGLYGGLSSAQIRSLGTDCMDTGRPNRAHIEEVLKDEAHTQSTLTRAFFLAGLFYGSMHLVLFRRSFYSETEALLWKMSSIAILVSGIPFVIACRCYDTFGSWGTSGRLASALKVGGWVVSAFLFLFYIFCRVFIIFECFRDVARLPDSAFEVPRWSQYFPHIA